MSLSDTLTISSGTVYSSKYSQLAAHALVEAVQATGVFSGYLPKLVEWSGAGGGHLPVIWGSGWACDVPLYASWIEQQAPKSVSLKERICQTFIALLTENYESLWHECIYVAEVLRRGYHVKSFNEMHDEVLNTGHIVIDSHLSFEATCMVWLNNVYFVVRQDEDAHSARWSLFLEARSRRAVPLKGVWYPIQIESETGGV